MVICSSCQQEDHLNCVTNLSNGIDPCDCLCDPDVEQYENGYDPEVLE